MKKKQIYSLFDAAINQGTACSIDESLSHKPIANFRIHLGFQFGIEGT
jgi:hypothetical protein